MKKTKKENKIQLKRKKLADKVVEFISMVDKAKIIRTPWFIVWIRWKR